MLSCMQAEPGSRREGPLLSRSRKQRGGVPAGNSQPCWLPLLHHPAAPCRLPPGERGDGGARRRGRLPALLPDPVWLSAGACRASAPGLSRPTDRQVGGSAGRSAPACDLTARTRRRFAHPGPAAPASSSPAGQGRHRHPIPAQAALPQGVHPAEQRRVRPGRAPGRPAGAGGLSRPGAAAAGRGARPGGHPRVRARRRAAHGRGAVRRQPGGPQLARLTRAQVLGLLPRCGFAAHGCAPGNRPALARRDARPGVAAMCPCLKHVQV